jgi:lysophospholipase L1-like esterase
MIFLCLGNSLTSGYPGYSPSIDGISNGYGNEKSQYIYWLYEYCLEFLEKNLGTVDDYIMEDLKFINKGIPGELTRNLLNRLERDVINYTPKPEYSIIIGGTNDLGWGIPINKILDNIKSLHNKSREKDIASIGANIPPIRQESTSGNYHERKVQLNQKLSEYFETQDIPFIDLFNGMANTQGNLKKEYAVSDGLHFSVQGYKQMGLVIFNDVIKRLLEAAYL